MPASLNAYELRLSTPICLLHVPLGDYASYAIDSSANVMVDVYIYVSLWLAEMLSFNQTSLTQNLTQKERLLKKLANG